MLNRIALYLLATMCTYAHANLTVRSFYTDDPQYLQAEIVGHGIPGDVTPHPCYHVTGCRLKFAIKDADESSPQNTFPEYDNGWPMEPVDESGYNTLGLWTINMLSIGQNLNRRGTVYRFTNMKRPCVTIQGFIDDRRVGPLVANCAEPTGPAPTCVMTPDTIYLKTQINQGGRQEELTADAPIKIACNTDSTVTVSTEPGEKIVLSGQNEFYALLDWGQGYGEPGVYTVVADRATTVRLRASIKGAENAAPGIHQGTAIVNVSYE